MRRLISLVLAILFLLTVSGCSSQEGMTNETTTTPTQQPLFPTEPTQGTTPKPMKYALFTKQALTKQPKAITGQELTSIHRELTDILDRKNYDENGKELIWDTVILLCNYYPNFEYLFSFLNPPDTATYLRDNILTPLDTMVDALICTQNGTGGGTAADSTKTVAIDLTGSKEENIRVMIHELRHMVTTREHSIVSSNLYMALDEGGATLHQLAIAGGAQYNDIGSIFMHDLREVKNWFADPDYEGYYFRSKGIGSKNYADWSSVYFKLLALTDFETMRLFDKPAGENLIREELGRRYGDEGLLYYDSLSATPDFDAILNTEPLFLKLFISRLSEVEAADQMFSYMLLYRLYRMTFAPEYLFYDTDCYELIHPALDYSSADRTVAESVVHWGVLNGEALTYEEAVLTALVLSGRTTTKDSNDYWERHGREYYNPLSPFAVAGSWYVTEDDISIYCVNEYPHPEGISHFERELVGNLHAMVGEGLLQ